MEKEYYEALAKVRLERAKELLQEATDLLFIMEMARFREMIINLQQQQNILEIYRIMMISILPAKKKQKNRLKMQSIF